ncbi:MAG: 2,3-bisphosphoglycerate-independent phosphoglycerate mutase [Calditrichaeota bacterium]|nr:MAG: 2,3-bisphosphoglycerate-independent phosphoglycerate mutase [Calditrichota bacterium]
MKKKIILVVLDGFGINPTREGNAVVLANTPTFDKLWHTYPHTLLDASAQAVGLPAWQIGGSEVGHMHLSSGRIIQSDLAYIDSQIQDGEFFENAVLKRAMLSARQDNKRVHLLGLLSDGGVHSSIEHLLALLELAKKLEMKNVFVHCILDGRDVPPKSAAQSLTALEKKIESLGVGQIASVCGRYYSMDRDNRWDRVTKALDVLVKGTGRTVNKPSDAIKNAYENGETDEFVIPTVILDDNSQPRAVIEEGDSLIGFNFRGDRMRQDFNVFLKTNIGQQHYPEFPNIHVCAFMQYADDLKYPVAFSRKKNKVGFGQYVSEMNMTQLRISESEKYPHVSFFFNIQSDEMMPGEERIKIPSPAVSVYNEKPEMSANEVTDAFITEYQKDIYDFMLVNYANSDMVGHTGILDAAVKAVETVDLQLKRILENTFDQDTTLVITADHGNSEEMVSYLTGEPHTAHTLNCVPFIVADHHVKPWMRVGGLSNVSPTLLQLMDKPKPSFMDKDSLIVKM